MTVTEENMKSQPEGKQYAVETGGRGVLVLHAWWGLNDTIKSFCSRLAEQGFSTLAPDLYHGQVATDIGRAKQLSGKLERQVAHDEIKAAARYLREKTGAKIGLIGFSLGANLALWGMDNCAKDVGVTVVYYGTSGGRFRKAMAPVLGHFAENDPFEEPEQVAALERHLRDEHIPITFHVYPGTRHWFAEPDRPEFDPGAAALAWQRTVAFLKANL